MKQRNGERYARKQIERITDGAQFKSTPGLVIAPTRSMYALRALRRPAAVTAMLFATAIGACQVGLLGTGLLLIAIVVIAVSATRFARVRHSLDRASARRMRDRRDAARTALLRSTNQTRQTQYVELRELVATTECSDPALAERMELESLLEYFAKVSVAHQRCIDAMQPIESHLPTASLSPHRSDIAARRLECRDRCEHYAGRLSCELDAIEELLRLLAQRSACDAIPDTLDSEIERRLEDLDEMDTALRQFST